MSSLLAGKTAVITGASSGIVAETITRPRVIGLKVAYKF